MKDNRIVTLGRFKTNLNLLCNNLREIFHNNYSFITLSFLLLYSFEQGLLLYFSIKLSPELALGIGLFVLIMMTTISIERLSMESKNKKLERYNTCLKQEKDNILRKYVIIKKRLEE